jgi:hypothetical protein
MLLDLQGDFRLGLLQLARLFVVVILRNSPDVETRETLAPIGRRPRRAARLRSGILTKPKASVSVKPVVTAGVSIGHQDLSLRRCDAGARDRSGAARALPSPPL